MAMLYNLLKLGLQEYGNEELHNRIRKEQL